jgi:hypothetical protein
MEAPQLPCAQDTLECWATIGWDPRPTLGTICHGLQVQRTRANQKRSRHQFVSRDLTFCHPLIPPSHWHTQSTCHEAKSESRASRHLQQDDDDDSDVAVDIGDGADAHAPILVEGRDAYGLAVRDDGEERVEGVEEVDETFRDLLREVFGADGGEERHHNQADELRFHWGRGGEIVLVCATLWHAVCESVSAPTSVRQSRARAMEH